MISTYDEYLPTNKSLSLEEMTSLHKELVSEIGTDEDALELYEELVETANKYSVFRSNWCSGPGMKSWIRILAVRHAIIL